MIVRIGATPIGGPTVAGLLLECHERIRRYIGLAASIGKNQPLHPSRIGGSPCDEEVAAACAEVERYFTEALPLHARDEDESLLPRLRGFSPEVDEALRSMEAEHRAHEPEVAALVEAVAEVRLAPSDWDARARLRDVVDRLEPALERHLAAEEARLLPALDQALSPRDQATVIDEIRARRRKV